MQVIHFLFALGVCFLLPFLASAQLAEVSEIVETRLVTLTELQTLQETIFSQFRSLQSTIDSVTVLTLTQSSTTSVITYSYEVGPSGIGWEIPSPSNGELLPTQPTQLPGSWILPIPQSTPNAPKTSTINPLSTSANTRSHATTSVSDSMTATITSFPTGFTPTELSGTTYTENGWITTTDSNHHTTLLPLIVIGGGHGIVFWDLPPLPNVEFIFPNPFPKFPKLPSLPKFHLPCVKILGVHISGDCSEPPETDGPSDGGGGSEPPKSGNPPKKSQPPKGPSSGSQPSKSLPSNTQVTKTTSPATQTHNDHSTTSRATTQSTTTSSSTCRTYITVSNCIETCASTVTTGCASWGSTCSQTSTICSAEETTSTASVAVCPATTIPATSSPKSPTSISPTIKSVKSSTRSASRTNTSTDTHSKTGSGRITGSSRMTTGLSTRPTTFKTVTKSTKQTRTASACVRTTIIDCIYNYETVPEGQPCVSTAAAPLPALCTAAPPFAGGSGIPPPPVTTTTNSPVSTPVWSSQFCYPKGTFGSTPDISSAIQNQSTVVACTQAAKFYAGLVTQLEMPQFNYRTAGDNGAIYNYYIWFPSGCETTDLVPSESFSSMCQTAMRNDYINCNNGGIGGYISWGCTNFEFKASLTPPGEASFPPGQGPAI